MLQSIIAICFVIIVVLFGMLSVDAPSQRPHKNSSRESAANISHPAERTAERAAERAMESATQTPEPQKRKKVRFSKVRTERHISETGQITDRRGPAF
jgi:hypothetical protein